MVWKLIVGGPKLWFIVGQQGFFLGLSSLPQHTKSQASGKTFCPYAM